LRLKGFSMKTIRQLFVALSVLAVAGVIMGSGAIPPAAAQIVGSAPHLEQTPGMPWQLGGIWKFNASSSATPGFDVRGISYYRILYVPVGTLSACSLSIDSATAVSSTTGALSSPSIGGIVSAATIGSCVNPGEYITTSAAAVSLYGQVTPTITGTGSLVVVLYGYSDNPAAGGTSSNSISSPVDGSGYVEVDCKTGCGTSVPTSILAGQQAVTATAAALPSNALTKGLCVEALSTNSISIFVGPSGVTTSTGIELPPKASYCPALSNSNELYVVASTTGASVTWSGN
jgi:hypothetical protein